MIRVNLLDETQIVKAFHQNPELDEQTIQWSLPWFKNWIILGPLIAGFLLVLYLGYYRVAIHAPLNKVLENLAANQKVLDTLKPQIIENEALSKEWTIIKKEFDEYEKFLNTKKNWARVLNILSDELFDEIVFKKLEVTSRPYQKKRKTPGGGLVLDSIDCVVIGVEMDIPEDFQAKMSLYMKKIRENLWIKTFLVGMEDSGMNWNQSQKVFSTRMEMFFVKSFPQSQS